MPLFTKSPKAPQEVVRALQDDLEMLNSSDKKSDKAREDAARHLGSIKNFLFGPGDQDPQNEVISAISQEVYSSDVLQKMILHLGQLDFETRKDVSQVFSNLVRREVGSRQPTVEYICNHPDILFMLVHGYEVQDIALVCGQMLRECIRFESLCKIILGSEDFYVFFRFVEVSTFDVASDAFSTFKDLLTRHKILSADFLDKQYARIFENYLTLLNSENYVTRRQALKLLGELLLDRHNFTVMTRYICSPENLKLMMNLLKDKSRNIQFEAFHVFKVFVANPNKPKPILEILLRNQEKLIEFLSQFQSDRTEDEQFNDEKAYLIKQIRELKMPPT